MFPSNLLVVRVWRGRVRPLLLKPSGIVLALAEGVLDLLRGGVGRTLEEALDGLDELEEAALGAGLDMRVVRAMAHLASRMTAVEPVKHKVDPVKARLEVFRSAAAVLGGWALSEEERRTVLERVAFRLGCSVDDLEEVLWRPEEEIVKRPPAIDGAGLVRRYNLSAVQTMLFRAQRLVVDVRTTGLKAKRLLWTVKRMGLLYVADDTGWGIRLTVDGPASLLKQTRRYGTRLAKLIPYIIAMERWRIRADILGKRRSLFFTLDDSSRDLFPDLLPEVEEVFDSEVEREFYKSLVKTGPWRVVREPEPLVVDGRIMVPDFLVEYGGKKVYIEIVGFWTREYLERKLAKLSKLKDVGMIVAVDRRLACSSFKDLPHSVVVFNGRLRGVDVYPVLKEALGSPGISRGEEVSREEAEQLLEGLPDLDGVSLAEAVKFLASRGVSEDRVVRVLEAAGYRIQWLGLDPRSCVVKRMD